MATPKPREQRYIVTNEAIKAADGTWCFRGTILYASEIGDADRVAALLARGSIEVLDATDRG